MSLSSFKVGAAIPVNDMSKAREFYEGKLGLSNPEEVGDGGVNYECGGGTSLHVFPSPGNVGKSEATIAGWDVDDLEKTVDELSSKGVSFEQYDTDPQKTNEKGIATVEGASVAWFKDPDGNVHGLVASS